ncbi:MAG: SPOR domain-containing protein [Geminicoccaceae bacterium]
MIAAAGLCGADVEQTLGGYPWWLRGIARAEDGDAAAGYVEAVRLTASHFLSWTESYSVDVQLWARDELGRIPDGPAKVAAIRRGRLCARSTIDALNDTPWHKYQLDKLRTVDGKQPTGRSSIDLFDKSDRHSWSASRTRPPHRGGLDLPFDHFVYELPPISPGAAQARLLVVDDRREYLLPEFPEEGTPAWWRQVANVWAYGGNDNAEGCRTDELESNILYFEDSYQGPPNHFAIMAPNYLQHLPDDTLRDARWMALVYLALADTGTLIWWNKFVHDVERPVSAINRWIDSAWETRIGAPTFPAYPSGHSGFGAAGMAMMELLSEKPDVTIIGKHPDPMSFPMALPGLIRRWEPDSRESAWDKIARDSSMSRLGVHYELDAWGGERIGQQVARRTHETTFTTADNPSRDGLGSVDWLPWPDYLAEEGGCDFPEILQTRTLNVPAVGNFDGGDLMSVAYASIDPPREQQALTRRTRSADMSDVAASGNIRQTSPPQYRVQLMNVADPVSVLNGWKRIFRSAYQELANLEPIIEQSVDGDDVSFRLQVGAYDGRPDADALCRQLEARSINCIVVEHKMKSAVGT